MEGGKNVTVFVPPEKKQSVKETPTVPRVLHKPEADRYSVKRSLSRSECRDGVTGLGFCARRPDGSGFGCC